MNSIYLETSALLNVLFREKGYEALSTTIERADIVTTSSLTIIESRRAIARCLSEKRILEATARTLLGTIASSSRSWDILQITIEVQERASSSFPLEPVRTLDAIHLASALELKSLYPDLKVCSTDERILKNLEPLGLEHFL